MKAIGFGTLASKTKMMRLPQYKKRYVLFTILSQTSYEDDVFIEAIAWGSLATKITRFMGRGDQIYVEGDLVQVNYTDGNDRIVYKTRIYVDKVYVVKKLKFPNVEDEKLKDHQQLENVKELQIQKDIERRLSTGKYDGEIIEEEEEEEIQEDDEDLEENVY